MRDSLSLIDAASDAWPSSSTRPALREPRGGDADCRLLSGSPRGRAAEHGPPVRPRSDARRAPPTARWTARRHDRIVVATLPRARRVAQPRDRRARRRRASRASSTASDQSGEHRQRPALQRLDRSAESERSERDERGDQRQAPEGVCSRPKQRAKAAHRGAILARREVAAVAAREMRVTSAAYRL